MIVDFIMGILEWVVDLLPDWEPLGIAIEYLEGLLSLGFIQDALGIMKWLDHYLPVGNAVDLLGFTIVFLGIGWVYSSLMWVWRNLPGKAT
jgi:hypothetical protein